MDSLFKKIRDMSWPTEHYRLLKNDSASLSNDCNLKIEISEEGDKAVMPLYTFPQM